MMLLSFFISAKNGAPSKFVINKLAISLGFTSCLNSFFSIPSLIKFSQIEVSPVKNKPFFLLQNLLH